MGLVADRHICRINRCGALQPAARNYPCGTTREDLDELYLSDIQSVNWKSVREELRVLPVYDHTVQTVEPVSWAALSAPNAAYTDVLPILSNCPEHDEGILFAFLAEIQPDPYYGMRVVYDGQEGWEGLYLGALIASNGTSKTDKLSGHLRCQGHRKLRWNCRQPHRQSHPRGILLDGLSARLPSGSAPWQEL